MLKKKRLARAGKAGVVLAIAIVIILFLKGRGVDNDATTGGAAALLSLSSIKADNLFAGLLDDEKAFYFP